MLIPLITEQQHFLQHCIQYTKKKAPKIMNMPKEIQK